MALPAVGPEGMTRHRACVTGAIVSSVAFLESSINELYLEFQRAGDNGSSIPDPRPHPTGDALAVR